jgi:hypothetical protein
VVLLVLAIVWGALLVSWLRSRRQDTAYDSVGTFRRHLTVLERAAPSTVIPANRLRTAGAPGGHAIPAYRPPGAVRGGYASRPAAAGPASGLRPVSPAVLRRRQAQRRRRDIFFVLLAGVAGSFLLAIIPGLSIMWSVQVMFDVIFLLYVALLVRARNVSAERELKVTFMPAPARPVRRPSYDLGTGGYGDLSLRRVAN